MNLRSSRFRRRLPVLAVVLVAAYLRLNHLGWTEYKLDEANLSRLSLSLVRCVEFPWAGVGSSTGVANLPLAAWLLAIPYALSSNPIVATGFIALLNLMAVAACYGMARDWLRGGTPDELASEGTSYHLISYGPALVAMLLFAVAPWAVIYSRKLWAQNLLPPFVVAWAWTGWLAFVKRRPRTLIAHALLLAACIHLHYSGLWLIPVTLTWTIAFARRRRLRFVLIALAVFAATFAPFVAADLARGGENVGQILRLAQQPAHIDDQAARLSWLTISGQEIHSLAGPDEFRNYLASVFGGETGFGLTSAVGWIVLAGALAAGIDVAQALRRRSWTERTATALMMLTWLAVPVLVQSRHSLPVYPHYFIVLYPAPFLLAGWLIRRVATLKAGVLALAGLAGVVVLAALQSAQSIALQNFIAARATPGAFGVPVEMLLDAADQVAQLSRSQGTEVVVYSEGDNPRQHEGPAVFDVLLPPDAPHRFVDLAQAIAVYPRDAAALVVYSPLGLQLPDAVQARTKSISSVALRAGEAAAQIRAWPGQSLEPPPCGGGTLFGRWRNGVSLFAVTATGDWRGSNGWIALCYRVDDLFDPADVHWFNHVLGEDGRRWAQVDGPGYPSGSWRGGDVIAVQFGPFTIPTEAPAGRFTLRLGMYTWPGVVNVPVVDVHGNEIEDALEIVLGQLHP